MLVRPRAVPALLMLLLVLALPASASAANFVVNSTVDEADAVPGGFCESAAGKCTLRAAIEVTNLTLAEKDRIEFSGTVFKGTLVSTISPATALPAITVPLEIDGGTCVTEAGVSGPCVGVEGPSGQSALTVEADNTSILGLAITGASVGINVINASTKFTARGNWVGLKLNGVNGGNSNTGIFIDPDSNEATVGGGEAVQRNIISFNSVGLDIEGADDAVVRGNWFGMQADGTHAGPAGKNIEITDSTSGSGFKAEGNEVGATVSQETTECDGGCNVISGSTGIGIDLNGNGAGQNEAPASGPTFVRGNYIGVSPSGTAAIVNASYGILAGGADEVTVGGFPLGDANYFAGGGEAIATEEGESFIARGNSFGIGPVGAELTRPGKAIFALDQGVAVPPSIEQNLIFAGSIGIEQRGGVGHLTGNEIIGGSIGIYAKGEPGGGLIASNFISAASENGILVEGPGNEVRANSVLESGAAGIRFRNPPGIAMTGGLIGGSTSEKENLIQGSGGPAIEIVEAALEAGSETEIARNRGSGNAGLFIDLVSGANEGILPPVLSAAKQTGAEGTAEPGATVRVFRKASAEAGELNSFLGEAIANGSGAWKVAYGSVPAGTLITATQTNGNGATSELAQSLPALAEPSPATSGNPTGPGSSGRRGTTPPDTKIVKGPPKKTHKTTAKFKFTASVPGSTFQCKLDRKPFKKCSSPKTYKKLKPGKHVFEVRAIKAGKVDPTPAKRKFTVLR